MTPEAIRAWTITGTLPEVVERIKALQQVGVTHLNVLQPFGKHAHLSVRFRPADHR